MEYIVEKNLFVTKLENFLNEKAQEGYRLCTIVPGEVEKDYKGMGNDRVGMVNVVMSREN